MITSAVTRGSSPWEQKEKKRRRLSPSEYSIFDPDVPSTRANAFRAGFMITVGTGLATSICCFAIAFHFL
jgi:hypothetical protein